MIVVNICLSDIPAENRYTSEHNGKIYASIVVDERREPDKFGNTHMAYMSQSKEEREEKKDRVYVGNGKEYIFNSQPTQSQSTPQYNSEGDDLPF